MRARTAIILVATAVVGIAPSAGAQRSGFTLGFAGQMTAIDSILAADRGISRSGVGAQVVTDIEFMHYLLTSFELGTLFYGDRRPFSQSVICIPNCSGGSRTSTISTVTLGVAAGVRTPRFRLGRLSAGASARVGNIKLNASRTIGGCADCTKQELDLKAGSFVEYGITGRYGKSSEGKFAFSIGRRAFLSSDAQFKPSIVIHAGLGLERK
jgi:hypothetical protein